MKGERDQFMNLPPIIFRAIFSAHKPFYAVNFSDLATKLCRGICSTYKNSDSSYFDLTPKLFCFPFLNVQTFSSGLLCPESDTLSRSKIFLNNILSLSFFKRSCALPKRFKPHSLCANFLQTFQNQE